MMKRPRIGSIFIPLLLALAGAAVLMLWFRREPSLPLQKRMPGTDRPALTADGRREGPPGELERFAGRPAAELKSVWPNFRGPAGDGVSRETVPLARGWDKTGPPVLWSVTLGEGYAGPAVANGCVYLLDYDQVKKADALRCFSLADGNEIWRRSYPVLVKRQHGMSRTVPAVAGRFAVTLGPLCHVMGTDALTGEFLWGLDLVREEGATVPPWYAGQCPLIDRDRAILAPGGKNLLIAVDLATGKKVWATPNPRQWKMTHSSILLWTLAGRRMVVYCADGGVVGADAETGAMLWEFPGWIVPMANVPAPVAAGDGRLFLCGGYRAGSLMLEVTAQDGGTFHVKELFRVKAADFGSEQQTPIFFGNYIFGVQSKDAGPLQEQLICMNLDGRRLWASGREHRFGPYGGPYLVADGLLIVVNDRGIMTVVEAVPDAYRPLWEGKILDGGECWAPMALAGGRLLVRDLTRMVCLDLGKKATGSPE